MQDGYPAWGVVAQVGWEGVHTGGGGDLAERVRTQADRNSIPGEGQLGEGCQSLSGLKVSTWRGGPVRGVRAKQSEKDVAWHWD